MMKRIILHGHLADKYPHTIEVEAKTVAEAVSSLEQIPELRPEDGRPHRIRIDGVDTDIALYAEESPDELHIHPFEGGSGGNNGLGQVLLGVALVAVGIWNPVFLGAVGLTQGTLLLSGGLMALGGLAQMLTPMPEFDTDQGEQQSSRYLGASQNTVAIGTNIPLAYGIMKLGGHYLSFDVDAADRSSNADSSGAVTIETTWPALSDLGNVVGTDSSGTIQVGRDVYQFYDRPPVEIPVLLPVFSSGTPDPTNSPASAFST